MAILTALSGCAKGSMAILTALSGRAKGATAILTALSGRPKGAMAILTAHAHATLRKPAQSPGNGMNCTFL